MRTHQAGTGEGERGRTPSTGNQREWSYSHFVLGNKCCLSFRGSCNCMPHMLSTCGFTMRTTPPPPPSLPLLPPMLNANAELNPSTRRHNNKKRFTRLNVGKLTTRSVSGFAERHNTHTHTPTHIHTRTPPPSTLWHTKATTYPNRLKPKDFYCARYGVLIDTFCIGYFKGLKSQTPKYDKLPKL